MPLSVNSIAQCRVKLSVDTYVIGTELIAISLLLPTCKAPELDLSPPARVWYK